MEIKLELDTDKITRAAVAIAAAYVLGRVSVHLASPQLTAANALALIVIVAILYGPRPAPKICLKRQSNFCDDFRCDHPPLQRGKGHLPPHQGEAHGRRSPLNLGDTTPDPDGDPL
jgi:hypothetical protein